MLFLVFSVLKFLACLHLFYPSPMFQTIGCTVGRNAVLYIFIVAFLKITFDLIKLLNAFAHRPPFTILVLISAKLFPSSVIHAPRYVKLLILNPLLLLPILVSSSLFFQFFCLFSARWRGYTRKQDIDESYLLL